MPSWEEVAHDHGRFLYTVAYRLTMNHDDAQDLVQDVLLRVQRGLATYQRGSMEAWLSRITTNAFLDGVRRQKRRPQDPLPAENPERVLPTAVSPADALDAAVLPEHLQAALRDLPEDYRTAVVLCDVLDFSYEEIAEALDIPVGTVRSRIHRGRARLRSAVEAMP